MDPKNHIEANSNFAVDYNKNKMGSSNNSSTLSWEFLKKIFRN